MSTEEEKPSDNTESCKQTIQEEADRLERVSKIQFKYHAARVVIYTACAITLGSVMTMLYAYGIKDREFENGSFGTVVSAIIEIIKIIIGIN